MWYPLQIRNLHRTLSSGHVSSSSISGSCQFAVASLQLPRCLIRLNSVLVAAVALRKLRAYILALIVVVWCGHARW